MTTGNPYNNATDKMSILGPTLVFKGELIAEEDLVLKGTVEGTIQHTASLKIGKEGTSRATSRRRTSPWKEPSRATSLALNLSGCKRTRVSRGTSSRAM
jgi:hypothetical protein